MPRRERPSRSGLQVSFKFVGEFFSRQRHISFDFPGLELVGVNGSPGVALCNSCAEIVRGTDVGLRGMTNASKDVDVVHGSPPSRGDSWAGILSQAQAARSQQPQQSEPRRGKLQGARCVPCPERSRGEPPNQSILLFAAPALQLILAFARCRQRRVLLDPQEANRASNRRPARAASFVVIPHTLRRIVGDAHIKRIIAAAGDVAIAHESALRRAHRCRLAQDKISLREILEAGGVEPPSEKPCNTKSTCLSHSEGFAGRAQNRQDALPTSPMISPPHCGPKRGNQPTV
jgi:hypothetical protein